MKWGGRKGAERPSPLRVAPASDAPGVPDSTGSPDPSGEAGSIRWRGVSFEDRMATVDFRVGERAHICVDSDVCRSCTTRACVTACPADLFAPTSDGGILFNYEECFECGTCYMVCNEDGAITWTYPDGGNGVVFHHG
jgi:ferredoxin like protein